MKSVKMLIGLASSRTKGTNIAALHEHMCELAGSDAANKVLFRTSETVGSPIECDVVVAENAELALKVGLKHRHKLIGLPEGPSLLKQEMPAQQFDLELTPNDAGDGKKAVGIPRIDVLCGSRQEKEAIRRIFLRFHSLDADARTLLYATSSMDMLNRNALLYIECFLKDRGFNFLIWLEDDEDSEGEKFPFKVLRSSIWQDYIPTLIAADVLMTKRSDLAMDYLALDRPIIFIDSSESSLREENFVFPRNDVGKVIRIMGEFKTEVKRLIELGFADEMTYHRDKGEGARSLARKYLGKLDGYSAERALAAIMESCAS